MRIAVCEDDAFCRAQLEDVLAEYSRHNVHQSIAFSVYGHAEDLLEAAQRKDGFDIYLLDVIMPDMSGIALGRQLREAGHDGKIIYLTVSTEYAIDAFSVQAFNYLVKPIQPQRLMEVLDQAVNAPLSYR